jgi:putative copper export protein
MQTILPTILLFLHNVFTATWIGGLLLMVLVILPGLKKNPNIKEPKVAVRSVQKRLSVVAIISMVGLAATGMLMSRLLAGNRGLFNFTTPYTVMLSIKHILMLVMVALAVVRLSLNKKNEKQNSQKIERISVMVLMLNAIVGLVVLFLSAYLSVVL